MTNTELADALARHACPDAACNHTESCHQFREAARWLREVAAITAEMRHDPFCRFLGSKSGCTCGLDALRRAVGGGA